MSFPLPEPTPLSKPYWDALAQGRLTFQHCAVSDLADYSSVKCTLLDMVVGWHYRQWSDVFLVYNERRAEHTGDLIDRSVIGKVTYLLAF